MQSFQRLDLTISIDDVNPKNGWRILGDDPEVWLRKLNEEFGVKFTLFIPSNYHKQWPLSENKEWIKELASIEWLELAAHGHYHLCDNPAQYGECEWFELGRHEAKYRFDEMCAEWAESLDWFPMGWRSPGWLLNPHNQDIIDQNFDYVAVHYEHNRGLKWNSPKVFFGADGIHQTKLDLHNTNLDDKVSMIMFQSHIAGHWNDNVWNQVNYEQLRASLQFLFDTYDITNKTLGECV